MSSHPPSGSDLGSRLSTAVVLFHQAVAERVGLSAADLKTLDLIRRDGPFSASELARRTGLTGPAVTALMGRLEAGGHLTREPDADDRRRVVVRAVDPPHPQLVDAYAALGADLGGLIADYPAETQAAISDYLGKMVDALEQQTRRVAGLD
ncbi:MAG: MarR family transcriptional regulator [Actinomycetales bacterium]|nr:MarR family transcriptional regulator [Actinomycetales bacterium]